MERVDLIELLRRMQGSEGTEAEAVAADIELLEQRAIDPMAVGCPFQ